MAKKKELTQLDIDISNANKMGMSYGMYIGLVKPRTPAVPKKSKEKKRVCIVCGEDITYLHGCAKYCGEACREKHQTEARLNRLWKKTCLGCGKEFMGVYYKNYCSDECCNASRSAKMKAHHASKAMEGL